MQVAEPSSYGFVCGSPYNCILYYKTLFYTEESTFHLTITQYREMLKSITKAAHFMPSLGEAKHASKFESRHIFWCQETS